MTQIQFWQIGKETRDFTHRLQEYQKRINVYFSFEVAYLNPVKKSSRPDAMKKTEADSILSRIKEGDYLILLDEQGQVFDSRGFASFIEKKLEFPAKRLIFLCGGAYGFDESVYKTAKAQICLSKMTFSHQLIGLIFMEQLFRAFSIIHNHPYHND